MVDETTEENAPKDATKGTDDLQGAADIVDEAGTAQEGQEDTVDVDLASADIFVNEPKGFFENQESMRQVGMMVVLVLLIIIGVFIFSWASEPKMRPFVQLDMKEMISILDLLDKHDVPYDLEHDVLSVEEDDLQDVRLLLAREGVDLTNDKRESYLNQDSGFGVSQQLETARLKFEQEQNLAATIEELKSIKRAKVILALPEENVFARERDKTSATVVVNLKNSKNLPQEEVDAIVDLVASAVRGLDPVRVTVTDQLGRLLNSGSQDLMSARARRELDIIKQKETEYLDKIDSILLPVLGREEFIAQVDVLMDFTSVEQTSKRYNPDTPSIRSEMVVENRNKGSVVAGIPGALTNQPPMESQIPEEAISTNMEKKEPSSSHSEATRNYELDTTINHTRQQVGIVRRISVSVAVNYRTIEVLLDEALTDMEDEPEMGESDDEGSEPENVSESASNESSSTSMAEVFLGKNNKVRYEKIPRTEEELLGIRRLLEGAIGYSETRGDVLEVVNVHFLDKPEEVIPEPPFWESDAFWHAIKIGVGILLFLIFIFAIIKPLINRLIQGDVDETPEVADIEDQFADDGLGHVDASDASQYSYSEDGALQLPELNKDDEMLQMIRALVENEPELAIQVVKIWLEEDSVK